MPGPLDGVRVLDLTGMISGPMATMILADQGADVIKIEPPSGDLMRRFGVIWKGMSSSFLSNNHGKRSLTVDIKTPDGLAVVLKLAATADVLVQNFRPGAIERMGLGEAAVRAVRPDIVYVSISGFGEHGPYVDQRVYDPVIQALSGLAEIQVGPADRPAAHGAHRHRRQDDGGDGGAGGHGGAVRARTQRQGPACPPRDARRHDRLSLAGSQSQPEFRRQRGRSGAWPDGPRSRVQDAGPLHHGGRRVGWRMGRHVPRAQPAGPDRRPALQDRAAAHEEHRRAARRSPAARSRSGRPPKSSRACARKAFPARRY